jgi:hypothetical protein
MTHRIISTTDQSLADYSIWFTGTKEECEYQIPRIRAWASGHHVWAIGSPKVTTNRLSDQFQIIEL